MAKSVAYSTGYNAYYRLAPSKNPYPEYSSDYWDWERGYLDAEEDDDDYIGFEGDPFYYGDND